MAHERKYFTDKISVAANYQTYPLCARHYYALGSNKVRFELVKLNLVSTFAGLKKFHG